MDSCEATVDEARILDASMIGRGAYDNQSSFGGSKLDKMIEIIESIPDNEQAILFIQYPEIMELAAGALKQAEIPYITISPTGRPSCTQIADFQRKSSTAANPQSRVLILCLGSEMATGL